MVRDPEAAEAAGPSPRQLTLAYLREDKGKTRLRNRSCKLPRLFWRPRRIRREIRYSARIGPGPGGRDAREEAPGQRGGVAYRGWTGDGSQGSRGPFRDRGPQRRGISIPGKEEGGIQRKVMKLTELRDAYIADFLRVPFSRSRPTQPERDVYNSVRMDQALSVLIKRLIDRASLKPEEVGDVITGCAFQTGENWLYGGRHPVLLAGLPVSVPTMAIDRACASSMNAASEGAMEIMTGNSDVVLAGGMEHLTHVPMTNNPGLAPNTRLLTRPEYARYQMNVGYSMGLTAEKLAGEAGMTREEMDRFSLESHQKAAKSVDDGWFRGELQEMRVEVDGQERVIDVDQSIRKDTTMEQLAKLPSSFKPGGLITAGNSSPLNAGASLLALASNQKVEERGLKPLARIVSMAWAGVDPSVMGKGPVPASKKALEGQA